MSKSKKIKQNRYSGEFIEYGVLSALFDMLPESGVGLVAPSAQTAFDLAHTYVHELKRKADLYDAASNNHDEK